MIFVVVKSILYDKILFLVILGIDMIFWRDQKDFDLRGKRRINWSINVIYRLSYGNGKALRIVFMGISLSIMVGFLWGNNKSVGDPRS